MQTKNMVAATSENGHRRRQRAFEEQPPKPSTYYGRPMMKKPTWKWFIPLYFFLGGVAGGVAMIATMAEFLGGSRHRSTVRHARYLSLVLSMLCPIFLIIDLGRPTRFHHMLRVFKVTSPLNVGTWILTGFGLLSGALAARQAAEDNFIIRRRSSLGRLLRSIPTRPFSALHGLFGLALGSYTGVLLAATAVPLWQSWGVMLGPLFISDALTTGAAALSLMGAITGRDTVQAREELENVDTLGTVAQLGLIAAREVLVPGQINKPLRRGLWGRVFQFGAIGVGLLSPLAVRLTFRLGGWRAGRVLSATVSALSLLGGLAERFSITEAGKVSALDPLAYQALTKSAPGEARPLPRQQAAQAPVVPTREAGLVAPDI
jgi:formate-dependent nitrite reductase membrane component NrfD